MSNKKIDNFIAACTTCIVASSHFINDCLNDSDVKILNRCIKLHQDCIAICLLTIKTMANDSVFTKQIGKLCEEICNAVADECEKYSHIKHAKNGIKACRQCADACSKINKVKKDNKVDKGNL